MQLIDTFPTNKIKNFSYRRGRVLPFGASLYQDGAVNFSIVSKDATGCTLVIYNHLLTSRGIPMLLSGDEFANTQFGNNNAYCQDNEISWIDWSYLSKNREHF